MQMQHVSAYIDSHIGQIEAIIMLKFNNENFSGANSSVEKLERLKSVAFIDGMVLPSIETYLSRIYATKKSKIKCVNNLIASIGANLINLESSILGTHTGQSPHMQLYYNFWESKLLKSLIGLVVNWSVEQQAPFNVIYCVLNFQNDTKQFE